jgi:O-antigen ligase
MDYRTKIIFLVLLLALVMTIPLSANLNAWCIGVFGLFNLWFFFVKKKTIGYIPFFISSIAIIIVFFLGLINTSELTQAFKSFEAKYSLLVIPFLFLLTGADWEPILLRKAMLGFVGVVVACGLVIQGELLWELLSTNHPLIDFFWWRYSGAALAGRINLHPTYLSMYALLSIVLVYEVELVKKPLSYRTGFWLFTIGYLCLLVLHLSSKICFAVLVVVVIVLVSSALIRFGRYALIILVPAVLILTFLLNLRVFAIKSRFENYVGNPLDAFKNEPPMNHQDMRILAWYSSIQIIKENFWIGVGSGDSEKSLIAKYNAIGATELAALELNSHNQFLASWVSNGIFGIAALLLLYGSGIVSQTSKIYALFIFMIVVVSMTENILDRQQGAVFVAVFNTILFRYCRA